MLTSALDPPGEGEGGGVAGSDDIGLGSQGKSWKGRHCDDELDSCGSSLFMSCFAFMCLVHPPLLRKCWQQSQERQGRAEGGEPSPRTFSISRF
jgi:hypothetical protein